MRIRLFFDVDGVLLDSFDKKGNFLWTKTIEDDLNIDLKAFEKHFFKKYFLDVITGKIDGKEALIKSNLENNYTDNIELLAEYWLSKDSLRRHMVFHTIKKIKKYNPDVRVYLATHQGKYRAKYLWENLKFKDYFDGMFTSSNLGALKDNPFFFKLIEKELKKHEEEHYILFDDTEENIKAAKIAGWHAYHVDKTIDIIRNPIISILSQKQQEAA